MDMRLPSYCETCNKIRRHRLSGTTALPGAGAVLRQEIENEPDYEGPLGVLLRRMLPSG